ncbi:non-heme iron oxygenase ferredoxin subunit [Paraburkholderia aspalathi]|jgi:nitrite reductase/ring-hydroxylating ferredoxin subunit|uniref:Naphthalene 1,2-dioxygenase system ferredoxin subunit n=1 Tax=Paraburkholderia aspalathi TaxID=1324617 RepID=A0A1I7DC82_9BURK|nr:non-heme iron oxygenase ferredoxin subunit [Paraburkholderia aspalathi]SFU09328.1 naphthalene 1,2-dioxygenase system ferredoxin subunit [Paraburkholderia aspalathi]
MGWIKAICTADIAAGECQGVELNGIEIAIYNVDGRFHATSNICTHQKAYLTEGYLDGEFIECPLHQGRFNVVTGDADGAPVTQPVRVFPIVVEGTDVLIDVGNES